MFPHRKTEKAKAVVMADTADADGRIHVPPLWPEPTRTSGSCCKLPTNRSYTMQGEFPESNTRSAEVVPSEVTAASLTLMKAESPKLMVLP
mmetsp:Transcript_6648/g.23460  ORF Transcript_6648/g.23460 Transcript_6648/m.23460 type:complete len:91 (+) Transcript_6648:105-377(+)